MTYKPLHLVYSLGLQVCTYTYEYILYIHLDFSPLSSLALLLAPELNFCAQYRHHWNRLPETFYVLLTTDLSQQTVVVVSQIFVELVCRDFS